MLEQWVGIELWERLQYLSAGTLRYLRTKVYREPVPDGAASFGWRYGRSVTLGPDQRISPLAAPAAEIAVAELLP